MAHGTLASSQACALPCPSRQGQAPGLKACAVTQSPPNARKRQRLEDLPESKTINKITDLIGRGKVSIDAAAEIARHVVASLHWKCSFLSKIF